MTPRAKTWKCLVCLAILSSGPRLFAQAAPTPAGGFAAMSDAAAAQALDYLNNGKLPEAEDCYRALIAQFPTSGVVPEAMYRLGSIQYLQGEYNQAIETLSHIVSPPATPEIKAAGDALIPQIMAAEAAKMSPGDPGRKQSLELAIKGFDAFIQKYPKSRQVESATYGKAVAAYQNHDYDNAAKSLHENLQRFPNSDATLDNADLLAVVLTAQASGILRDHGDQDAAFAKFNEALGYLAKIIRTNGDVALANQAQFQIGEVLYDRGAAEKDPSRAKDLSNAILAYRAVQPPATLLPAQEARVTMMLARVRQAARGNNAAAVEEAQRQQDRENAKLQALKQAQDQTLNAQLRIAASYFLMQKYDETRVLLKYLAGFVEDAEQKKQIAYYMVLTYASQGVMDKAETAYNAFQAAYRGDPLGENLPLVMGDAYLSGSNSQPAKAAAYLQQEHQLYPGSPLVNDALNAQAGALIGLHRYDEALAIFQEFLAKNPPAEQAADAQRGIAAIYQQTGKLAEAVKQYQKIADTYPGTPMAEQNSFYAAGLETSLDMKQALGLLQAFVAKYPNGKYTVQAMMMIGQGQGDTPAALQTYKDVAAKYPKTDFGQQAYFAQASILARQQKPDDMVAVLRDFIKTYPDSKDIFYAYDTIGQTQVNKGKAADAIATYREMADQHADNPMAPMALYRVAELWRKTADSLGRYDALNDEQRAAWTKGVKSSIATVEELLQKFPDSNQAGVALKTLLSDHEMLVAAKQEKPEDIDKYFHDLAQQYGSNASAKSRIIFTLAAYTYKANKVMGLAQMGVAYNPALVYAPGDLDLYGSALLDQGKADAAYKVYQKIARDYPLPANTRPAQASQAIQDAQSTAYFGMATALDRAGKTADAGRLFAELKASYPWSPRVAEANFGIAKSLVDQNKPDEASHLLVNIVGSRTAPATLRAHAFLLIGRIQEKKGNVTAAIDSYLKTAAYYGGVEDAAAEGLWRGGQMLERQAEGLNEQSSPKKSDQIGKAVSAYKDIGIKYPDSPYVQQAQDRLKALGAG